MAKYSKKLLRDAYVRWAKSFVEEYMKNEEKYWHYFDHHFIYATLEFCRDYIEYLYEDGRPMTFIKDFLALQSPKIDKRNYLIVFYGGYPVAAHAQVKELSDMDFLAAKRGIFYTEINIVNKNQKEWKDGEAEQIIKMVRENLKGDSNDVRIKREIDRASINLETRVADRSGTDKFQLR